MRIPAYRVGVAAKELRISEHHLRRLCELGLVAAERSEGGHWQIPIEEIRRLRQDGIPEIPSVVDEAIPAPELRQRGERFGSGDPGALQSSKRVLHARDDVEVKRQLLEEKKVDLELFEVEEALSRKERARHAVEDAELKRQQAEVARTQQQERSRRWLDTWIAFGMRLLPPDRSPGLVTQAQDVLQGTLAHLDCDRDGAIVRARVIDEVKLLVAQWRRELLIEKCIRASSDRLSWFAKSFHTPSVWEVRARTRAAEAVGRVRRDAPIEEIIAVTQQAGDEVQAEFDAERRKKIVEPHCQ